MNLTSPLPSWVSWFLRIAVFGAIAVGVITSQFSTNIGKSIVKQYRQDRVAGSCSIDVALKINLRDGAQIYRDEMSKCLRKNDITFDDLSKPASDLLSRLPNNPKQYAGVWISRRDNCEYRFTLKASGYYYAEPIMCNTNRGSKRGIWAVLDDNMVWIAVPGGPKKIVTDAISLVDNDNFIVTDKDGSNTLFSKAGGVEPSLAVESTITIIPPDEQSEISSQMAAQNMDQINPPTLPQGKPISIAGSSEVLWRRKQDGAIMRWDPASGLLKMLPVDPVHSRYVELYAAATDDGLMIFETHMDGLIPTRTDVLLIGPDDKTVSRARLKIPRIDLRLVTLSDQSVLAVGGTVWQRRTDYDNKKKKRSNAVERLYRSDGQLLVDEIASLPGDIRYDYSVVALNDGRAMLLGGGSASAGQEMSDETFLLDVTTNIWRAGPRMVEARSGASATLMSNGSVLVVGGWTPDNNWNDGASRTTEFWDPRANGFVSGGLLPVGVANHHVKWSLDGQQKELILVGGWLRAWANSPLVMVFDVDKGVWSAVIDQCAAHPKTETVVIPFEFNDSPLMWCKSTRGDGKSWNLVSLERNAAGSTRIDTDEGIALGRYGIGFLPPDGLFPGMAVGGGFKAIDSAAVDAVWTDGRLLSLAPLNHARRYAQVFRRNDGSILVAGGLAGSSSRRTEHIPPLELLPAGKPLASARWQDIGFYNRQDLVSMGLLSDGSLLAIYSSGEVERLIISASDDKLAVQVVAFPSLNRKRSTSPSGYGGEIIVRELADGRIIVAGGHVQHHRIALLHDGVLTDGVADRFVGVGELSAARHYEIYNPASGSWEESAFSSGTSRTTAILSDGRVVKWGEWDDTDYWEQANRYSSDEEKQTVLEISSVDGSHWGKPAARIPPLVVLDTVQQPPELFVIQDELFLFGRHVSANGAWTSMVQWFDADSAGWMTLWQSGSKGSWSRNHSGRTIIRELPNGKRIVLPVTGLSGRGAGG